MPRDSDNGEWTSLKLKLVVEPQYRDIIKNLKIDQVTWLTYTLKALRQLHGDFGASIDVIIEKHDGIEADVQVQREDLKIFTTALTAFITDLSILGYKEIQGRIEYSVLQNGK